MKRKKTLRKQSAKKPLRTHEETLRSLMLRYEAILAAVPDIIMEVDNNKVYTWANEAGYKFFGDDVIGKEASCYFEGKQDTYNIVGPLFKGSDDIIYVESWQRRKDGKKRLLAWWCRTLKDASGAVTGALSTARDITERKQKEEEDKRLEETLQLSYNIQNVASSILQLSLEDIGLDDFLSRAFDLIFSVPIFSFEPAGCVFLVGDKPETLVLKVSRGVSKATQDLCHEVPFGRCLCGLAALTKEVQFACTIDERHVIHYEGMKPHGHYCVPIIFAGDVLGVLDIFLKEGMAYKEEERNFLVAVANTIAGVIIRKLYEASLVKSKDDLEVRVQKRTLELSRTNVDLQDEIKEHNKTEARLMESEAKYKNVVDNIGIGVALISPKMEILALNNQMKKWFPDINIGSSSVCYKVFNNPPREDICSYCPTVKTLKDGQIHEVITQTPSGNRIVNYRVLSSSIKDSDGNILAAIEMVEDITERRHIEELAAEADERYLRIITTITDYIYTVRIGEFGVVETIHGEGCLGVTGYTNKDFYADPGLWIKIVWPDDRDAVRDWARRIINGERVMPLEHRILRKDGAMRWIRNTAVLHFNSQGKLISYDGVVQDTTDHKVAEQERSRAEALLEIIEGMPDAVVVVDTKAKIINFNKALTDNFGYGQECIGMPMSILVAEKYHPIILGKIKECIEVGYIRNFEVNVYTTGKFEVPVLADAKLLKDREGRPEKVVVVFTDITGRKHIEDLKDEFLNMVSHELRTPLTAIKEGIGIVLDGSAGQINNEQKESLDIAKRNVDRLARLINSVLDFQKLGAGNAEFNMRDNDINSVVSEVQATMAVVIKEKKLDFMVELEDNLPVLKFDWDKIIEVLVNFVDNAVKFTEKGSITVKTFRKGNEVCVSVADTGKGIMQEDMPRLFHSFEQIIKDKDKKIIGSGLGLAISKAIIDTHKGKIWAESEFNKGTTFYFTLPLQ